MTASGWAVPRSHPGRGSPLRQFEHTRLSLASSPRKRPFLVSEEFGFHKCFRYGSAVHPDERFIPCAETVNETGNDVLSDTGFTRYQDSRLRAGRLTCPFQHFLHSVTAGDDPFAFKLLQAQELQFLLEPAAFRLAFFQFFPVKIQFRDVTNVGYDSPDAPVAPENRPGRDQGRLAGSCRIKDGYRFSSSMTCMAAESV